MKAVFVTDKPTSCLECEFCGYISGIENVRSCMLLGHHAFANADEEYRICPLKPMPNKQATNLAIGIDLVDGFKDGWNYGWNACIDEIIGDNNE